MGVRISEPAAASFIVPPEPISTCTVVTETGYEIKLTLMTTSRATLGLLPSRTGFKKKKKYFTTKSQSHEVGVTLRGRSPFKERGAFSKSPKFAACTTASDASAGKQTRAWDPHQRAARGGRTAAVFEWRVPSAERLVEGRQPRAGRGGAGCHARALEIPPWAADLLREELSP